jgi:hypothetical protein
VILTFFLGCLKTIFEETIHHFFVLIN